MSSPILSVVLSVHNRAGLIQKALESYRWQTLARDHWEVLIIDDMSDQDLKKLVVEPWKDLINLRYVRIDHTRHPIWKARNPQGTAAKPFENWYHTPAITTNLGASLARGQYLCLCHPEVIHRPGNFQQALENLEFRKRMLFGPVYLGNADTTRWLAGHDHWRDMNWADIVRQAHLERLRKVDQQMWWYLVFLPKEAMTRVGGVDLEYLHGVGCEDDDLRERIERAGWEPALDPEIQGIHQDHSNEKEPHRIRNTDRWNTAYERNRAVYFDRKRNDWWPIPANAGRDWTCSECLVEAEEHYL